jgi:hypothetical protein
MSCVNIAALWLGRAQSVSIGKTFVSPLTRKAEFESFTLVRWRKLLSIIKSLNLAGLGLFSFRRGDSSPQRERESARK